MSGPFVYKPTAPVTCAPQFQSPYTHTPRSATPFIPGSPYSRPPSLNPSPHFAAAPLPLSDGLDRCPIPAPNVGYCGTFWEPRRDHLPQWHEGNLSPWHVPPPYSSPLDGVGNLAGLSPYSQRRRHSFSYAYNPPLQVNPLLNAEVPVNNFFFDLSRMCDPLLYSREDLAQPVTYPPITRMRIVSDILPQEWDITLDLSPDVYEYHVRTGYGPPPITVQDVLQELYCQLQLQISHDDWARLSREDMNKVSRAFDSRCRAAPGGNDGYLAERANGVRRVDYLRGKTRLLGLLKVGNEDGRDTFKFVTTKPYQSTQ